MCIHRLSREYQQQRRQCEKLENILHHQEGIKEGGEVPRCYSPPKQLQTSNATLSASFKKEHSQLFFKHLKEVITTNKVELEITKGRLSSIVSKAEEHLSKSPLSPEETTTRYYQLLADNKIKNRIPIPALQAILTFENTKKGRKRRRQRHYPTETPPPPKKQTTSNNFLSLGHQILTNPP